MLTIASRIKALAIGGAILVAGFLAVQTVAPARRHHEGPLSDTSGDRVPVLPPLTQLAKLTTPMLAERVDRGTVAGPTTDKDGSVAFQDEVPATIQLSWIKAGRLERDERGETIGYTLDIPRSCLSTAQRWVGHAMPVDNVKWRKPEGDIAYTVVLRAVVARICKTNPDPHYDKGVLRREGERSEDRS